LFQPRGVHPAPHSFPTRRSSDLGALEAGAASHAPFDAILLEGAVPQVPHDLLEQLTDGGRLVAVIADAAFGRAQLWRRMGKTCEDRKSTRLNSSHLGTSYAVFCL